MYLSSHHEHHLRHFRRLDEDSGLQFTASTDTACLMSFEHSCRANNSPDLQLSACGMTTADEALGDGASLEQLQYTQHDKESQQQVPDQSFANNVRHTSRTITHNVYISFKRPSCQMSNLRSKVQRTGFGLPIVVETINSIAIP